MNPLNPAITVLMPLYNAREYLSFAIESILKQTFTDFELLIIDDSNDGSYEIAKSYSDARIRIIKNEIPLGLRKSSNLGIRNARGKYIARMEGDDIAADNRLEKQYKFMEENPSISVCSCYMEVFGNEKGVWKYPLVHNEIKAGLIWGITFAHPASFFRKDFLINGNYFYKEDGFSFAEDWEFFYNMRNEAVFANINEVLYYYRRSSGSVTKRMRPHREQIMTDMFTRILSDFGINFSNEDIFLHKLIADDFVLRPDASNILRARQWITRLVEHNRKKTCFHQESFEKICEEKWRALFYHLVPYGYQTVYSYFRNSPNIRPEHLKYYFKSTVNNILGRNIIEK